VIGELGLDCQIVRNRAALMVLPAGVTKGSGLGAVLTEMNLSPHNTVAVGDAENDLSLFGMAELGVAVANAVPSVRRRADLVLEEQDGAGVAELLTGPYLSGARRWCPPRRWIEIGTFDDGTPTRVPGSQARMLVTGPAGCGKSSTLAALINLINEDRPDHIITVEDPVEFVHRSKTCVVNQRQVRKHTGSFASALRAALREDPDVIAIGELRDLETISLAITAAETGHLVLGTLHTNDAARTINRILDAYPPDQQSQIRAMISESLRAIISQKLVPTVDGSRRVPALEILLVNIAVSNLIREERVFQLRSVMQTGRNLGMRLFDDSLLELMRAGTISKEAARKHCDDPKLFV